MNIRPERIIRLLRGGRKHNRGQILRTRSKRG